MNQDDIIKKLEKLDLPQVELKHHQQMLKTVSFESKPESVSLFSQCMFFLKKFSWAGLIPLILVAGWFSISFKTQDHLSYAQEMLQEVIVDFTPQKDASPELVVKLKVLEEAMKSNELQYLGEEIDPLGNVMRKFTFKVEDIDSDIEIFISMGAHSADAISVFPKSILGNIDIPIDFQDGKIVNLEEIKKLLKDDDLHLPWVRDFIHQQNRSFFEDDPHYSNDLGNGLGEDYVTTMNALHKQLKELFLESDLIYTGQGGAYGDGKLVNYSVSVRKLTGQKALREYTEKYFKSTIDKLQKFNTERSKFYVELLHKALDAKDLKFSSEGFDNAQDSDSLKIFSFTYQGVSYLINIDPQSLTEDFISIYPNGTVYLDESSKKTFTLTMKNGSWVNLQDLKKQFGDLSQIKSFDLSLVREINYQQRVSFSDYYNSLDSNQNLLIQAFQNINMVVYSVDMSEWQDAKNGKIIFQLVPING